MPLSAITPANVATFLDGTNAGGSSSIYGVSVTDASMTVRAITPAIQYYQKLIADATIVSNQTLADSLALTRAARLCLQHLRQTLITQTKVNSYSIGALTVTKPELNRVFDAAIKDLYEEEQRIYATLISPGEAPVLSDLVVQNPILNSGGASEIDLDTPPYGGFI